MDVGPYAYPCPGGMNNQGSMKIQEESYCYKDKHKAPTHHYVRPLSLQNGSGRF